MIVSVRVGVAVRRPPSPRNTRFLTMTWDQPDDGTDPTLTAASWAASRPGVVMPVSTELLEVRL